jgi:hypothetical protein
LGRAYRPVLVDTALGFLISEGTVRAATHRPAFEGARGALGSSSLSMFPTPPAPEARPALPEAVFRASTRTIGPKLTFIVSGGGGVYSDSNPWFGQPELFNEFSPSPGDYRGRNDLDRGLRRARARRCDAVAESDFYVYGAASGLFSISRGQDIYRDDDRNELHPDKGYVGLLYADPATGNTAQFSLGRQTYTLNSGFLISMISNNANAGERGATYLGPRNTTDFSALFNGEFGRFRYALFYIDPDELEDLESNTKFAGANFGYGSPMRSRSMRASSRFQIRIRPTGPRRARPWHVRTRRPGVSMGSIGRRRPIISGWRQKATARTTATMTWMPTPTTGPSATSARARPGVRVSPTGMPASRGMIRTPKSSSASTP